MANEISTRLQQGWTLLDDVCPIEGCLTPLVRSRENEVYCVNCRMYCVTEDRAGRMRESAASASSAAPAPANLIPSAVATRVSPIVANGRASSLSSASPLSVSPSMTPPGGCLQFLPASPTSAEAPLPSGIPARNGVMNGRHSAADSPAAMNGGSVAANVSGRNGGRSGGGGNNGSDPTERMGQLLLRGWAMLAESCPAEGCRFPLMRNRDGRMRCCACDRWVEAPEADVQAEGSAASAAPPAVAAAVLGALNGHDSTNGNGFSNGLVNGNGSAGGVVGTGGDFAAASSPLLGAAAFESHRRSRDAVSAQLGQHLLQGYTMLDEICRRPGCGGGSSGVPLLAPPGGGAPVCIGCDPSSGIGGDGGAGGSGAGGSGGDDSMGDTDALRGASAALYVEAPAVSDPEALPADSGFLSPAAKRLRPDSNGGSGGDASAALASNLLRGWAMLSASCARCGVPLMRDSGGVVRCVGCNREIGVGGDKGAAASSRASGGRPSRPGEAAATGATVAAAAAAAATNAMLPPSRASGDFAAVAAAGGSLTAPASSQFRTEARERALSALYAKLEEAQRELPGSGLGDRCAALADLIAKVAAAAAGVEALRPVGPP